MSDKIKALIPELAEKLAKQRKPCKIQDERGNVCVYDDGKGGHCLVGHLMTKDELSLHGSYEGTIELLTQSHPEILSQFNESEIEILRGLQEWHDYGQYQLVIDTNASEDELKDRIEFELNYAVDNGRFWEGV